MKLTTGSTSIMVNTAKSEENEINEEHSDKQQMKSNEQTFENVSIMYVSF
jgi:hypothetical protein